MAQNLQTISPIIPVTDERLNYPVSAPKDHKAKVERYNDMLEDIYQRELELNTIKLSLIDMREQIAQEARILEGVNTTDIASQIQAASTHDVVRSDSSDSDAEQVLSDSSSSNGGRSTAVTALAAQVQKKVAKNIKTKAKGNRRSKVPDAQLGGDWDYKLELGRGSRGRRASDASSDAEDDGADSA
ncbi:hypothetical protein D9613_003827 [Agrocybe pediades]|uniref:Uncharacterized protein n=1 Tax=Agrocybe pediades TaxID=84607 RepID=A0A8H4QJS7_9AGAR|nr:hypothetical protein D9613_003827 [Agrocybe pediades]